VSPSISSVAKLIIAIVARWTFAVDSNLVSGPSATLNQKQFDITNYYFRDAVVGLDRYGPLDKPLQPKECKSAPVLVVVCCHDVLNISVLVIHLLICLSDVGWAAHEIRLPLRMAFLVRMSILKRVT
jgi:hypothetical protein